MSDEWIIVISVSVAFVVLLVIVVVCVAAFCFKCLCFGEKKRKPATGAVGNARNAGSNPGHVRSGSFTARTTKSYNESSVDAGKVSLVNALA